MSFAEVLGYFGLTLVLLASLNGFKKWIHVPLIRKIIGYHYMFAAIAFLVISLHFIVNFMNDNINIFGFIAFIFLSATVMLGGAFKQRKDKRLFLLHRRISQALVIVVFIHVLVMLFS